MRTQAEQLKAIFTKMLETNIEIMSFQITLTKKEDEIRGLKKFIRYTKKAIDIVNSVKHQDILISLYNAFLNGKETYFMSLVRTVNDKNTITKWDKSEKGYQEFLKLEEEAKAKSKEEYEKKLAEQKAIQEARASGKKVEMVYENGKLTPRIVEEC